MSHKSREVTAGEAVELAQKLAFNLTLLAMSLEEEGELRRSSLVLSAASFVRNILRAVREQDTEQLSKEPCIAGLVNRPCTAACGEPCLTCSARERRGSSNNAK